MKQRDTKTPGRKSGPKRKTQPDAEISEESATPTMEAEASPAEPSAGPSAGPSTAEATAGATEAERAADTAVERTLDGGNGATASSHHPMVAIGVTPQDIGAIAAFFATLAGGSGITFLIVPSASNNPRGLSVEAIAAQTELPVTAGADGLELEPDHIYLIPPGTSLVVEGGTLRSPQPQEQHLPLPAIDAIFRSLAADCGEDAICVILSGAGADGAASLKVVKECGGLVIVQDPDSARFESMPRNALATGLADRVLPIQEIAPRLAEYAHYLHEIRSTKGMQSLREEAADSLAKICTILHRRTGHDFSRYKRSTLVRRIQHRLQVLRETSVASYLKRLQEEPKEVDLLFKDMLIGVTSFFRDAESFDALAQHIIPKIFEERDRENDGPVRVWVPGCASGEEAYTIAILLSEYIGRTGSSIQAQIFATDIDDEALEFARMARYPESIADQISPERLDRFFIRSANNYQVNKEIREMCIFSTHNLIKDPPFSRLDLISCRNMLIYLEHDIQKQLIPLFHYSLRSGGYLFLGPSESIAGHLELFRTVDKKHRIFQCKNSVIRPPVSFPMMEQRRLVRHSSDPQRLIAAREQSVGSTLERILLNQYAPACVLVNEQQEILYFSGRTGNYLEQPSGTPSTNVINMARKGLRLELRTALHKAMKLRKQVERDNVVVHAASGVQRINLVVRPIMELGEDTGLFMVIFQERGPVESKEQADAEGMIAKAEEPIVQQLEHELRTTREHLQATIEELETSNEELTSSNEELLSMNEEIQSANEELQTSKEELQSVNEELQSVNEELHKKVDELDRANSDLQNHFQSTQIATIFLDSALAIKKFTPTAVDVFRLIDSDIGRPIIDIAPRFNDKSLLADIKDVLRNLSTKERQVQLADGDAWYIMRILPYRTIDNVIDGVVLTFVDVTELKRAEERITQLNRDLDHRVSELETLLQVLPVGVVISDDPEGRIVRVNAAARRIFGVEPSRIGLGTTVDIDSLPLKVYRNGVRVTPGEMLTRQVARSGEARWRDELQVEHPDGSIIHIIGNASPLLDQNGKVRGVIAAFADITATTEAKLQAEERAIQQAAAAELGVYALREATAEEVIAKAVTIVHKTLGTEYVEVLELLPDNESLLLKGGYGWKEGYIGSTVIGMGFDSQAGYTLASEEPVIVDDLSTEVRFRRSTLLSDHNVTSGVSVIIYGKDRPFGALGAHTQKKRKFTRDAISFLQSVANVLGTALELQSHVTALAQSEERYRSISELISDYTYSFAVAPDGALSLEWITDSIGRITGYTAAEFIAGAVPTSFIHADDMELVQEYLRRLLNNEVAEIEYRVIAKDGGARWLKVSTRPVWDEETGRVVKLVGGGQDVTARREAEDQLERSRQDLVDFIENASVGLHWVDKEGRIVWANQAELEMLGYARDEYIGRYITDFHADQETIRDILQRLMAGEMLDNYEARLRAMDGSIRYVLINSSALVRDGEFIHTRCFTRDITERKLAEQALREGEERLRLAVESTALGTWDYDLVSDTLTWSERSKKMFGLPADAEITYDVFLQALHPEDRERTDEAVRSALSPEGDAGYDIEYRVLWSDGTVRWIAARGRAFFDASDRGARAVRFTGTVLDITEQKEAQEERTRLLELEQQAREQAEEAQARSSFLAEASGIMTASLDYQTTLFSLANLAVPRIADYCYIFEVGPEQSVAMMAYAHADPEKLPLILRMKELYLAPTNTTNSYVWKALVVKEPRLVTAQMMEKVDTSMLAPELMEIHRVLAPQSVMLLPLMVRGEAIGILVLALSESEREYDAADLELGQELARRAAAAMDNARLYREAQHANQAKDQFLAVLSHELRTPLTPALASVEALQDLELSEETRTYINLIQRNIELEARLIDDLLDLTRIIKGKLRLEMEDTDIHDLVQNVLDICGVDLASKKLLLVVELEAAPHRVRGDAARLQQVFWNIIKNAVKFTPNGGTIAIRSRNEGSALVVSVSDTGIGIDEKTLPVIFNAFEQGEQTVTRRFGGLGLGLAISKSLVEMHGGELAATSPGRGLGATFTVTFPMAEGETAATSGESGRAILLVEDYRENTGAVRALLERPGYRIFTAYGIDAAAKVASEQRFDLLIYTLGPEENAAELLATLRAERHVPAIAIVANGQEGDAIASGSFDAAIARPFGSKALHEMIDRLPG